MKTVYTVEDVNIGDYFAYIKEDGSIMKEGSFKVTATWGDKFYGRGYRKRQDYSIPFKLDSFYSETSSSNRALLTQKEFTKGFIGTDNRFNAKTYIEETLNKYNITFSKIRFRQKVLYKRAWIDVRGDRYSAEYIMALEIHGAKEMGETTREDSLIRRDCQEEIAKHLRTEIFNGHRLDVAWNSENYVTGR